jgi:hypothetical protein
MLSRLDLWTRTNRVRPADVVMPTAVVIKPYVALSFSGGQIADVRHRGLGDTMPDTGVADCGVFGFTLCDEGDYVRKLIGHLTTYLQNGDGTPDLLYFMRHHQYSVLPVPVDASNTRTVNTPEELAEANR